MTRFLIALGLVLGLLAVARAQAPETPAAPTLTEAQAQAIRVLELRTENAQLRVALAQAQLDVVTREGAAYLTSLARDGFTLTRSERGWTYVPNGAE